MKQIFRIFTLIAVAMLTAGQAWAGTVELGKIIYTQGDNDGGTLQFYEDLACNNKITLTSGKSSALTVGTVYIKAKPAFGYTFDIADGGSKVTFITAEVTAGTGAAGARTRNGEANIEVGGFIDVTATATKGVYQITMPADEKLNVTLTATFPEKEYRTGVNYIDIDGQTKQAEAYVLDGTEEVLGEPGGTFSSPKETWYVCDKNLSYTTFNFSSNCNVNIILADNVEVSVINSNGDAISNSNYSSPDSQDSFGVYGQSKGSDRGALTVKCTSSGGNAIDITGGVIISHCNLTAEGEYCGIRAKGSDEDVIISGAEVTANAGTSGFAIYSKDGGVSITGGTVIADGTTGITSSDDIVLGWTDANDYIKASSYSVGSNKAVKTADGQRFVAYTPGATESDPMTATAIVSGSIAKENGSYPIDGKTLKPLDGYTVTLADDISLMDGTTAKTPDFTIGTTPYYIYKASTEQNPVTLTLSYDGTDFVTVGGLPEGTTFIDVENQPLQRSFAMPAQDVALTATAVTGLTASGTYTYSGSAQTPAINLGESAFEATNYTVTGITPKEGSNSQLTDGSAVNAGEYSLAITGLGQYIGTASVDFTIGKANYNGTTTALGYVCYGQVTADAKLTLPDLPDGASYATTGNVSGDSPALIDGAPTVSGTTLTYNTTSQDEGTSATITIGVTGAKNYNDYDVVVTVKANIIENDNGTVVTKIGDDTYNVSIDEGDGSGGVIVIPGGGNSIDVADLDYSRTLTAPTESNKDAIIGGNVAKLYTTCQPTVPATNANVKYFTLTSVSGTTLNFEEVTTPAKDTPYLMAVMGNSDIPERVTAENETLTLKKLVTGTPVSGYTMMGTQTGLSNADAISAANGSNVTYILQAQSTWGKVTNKAGVYIPPFRAFIVGPAVSTARELNSSFEGETVGIDTLRLTDADGTEQWYDLNGRRIEKPTRKGVFIHGGRKEVIR